MNNMTTQTPVTDHSSATARERHRDRRGRRLPRGLFWYSAGVYGVRFVCGAGHDHKEPVGALKEDAVRVHHERRSRVLAEPGWCPRVERRAVREQKRADEARRRRRKTFREYADDYMTWAAVHKRSAKQERCRLSASILPTLGGHYLDEITSGDVERFRDSLLSTRTQATANRYRDQLSAMFKRAIRLGLLTTNPVTGVPKFREAGQRLSYLTLEEEAAVSDALAPRLRPAFTVSVQTGLRWSEQAGLRWSDVDILTGIITVPLSKNGRTRQVPMNSLVRSTLLNLGASREHPDDPSERVFRDSYRQTARLFGQAVQQAQAALREMGMDSARLDCYTWHCNRHTFASRLVMASVHPRTVQELGGWRTLGQVERYSHLDPEHLFSAVERLVNPAQLENSRKANGNSIQATPARVV